MLPWDEMIGFRQSRHLVTGVYRNRGKINRLKLLQSLVLSIPASGDWSIRTSAARGEDLVQVAFEKEADAVWLGDALGAKCGGTYSEWRTQRVFGFSTEVAKKN